MSYKQIFTSRLSLSFIVFISLMASSHSSGLPNCKVQWGLAKVTDKKSCTVEKTATTEPSSILVNNFQWKTGPDLFSILVNIKNISLLSGLKLSFYYRGEVKAYYTLPLYTDPEYNILKEDTTTLLSIPKSSLKWVKSDFIKDAIFDGLTIYLGTKANPSKPLIISLRGVQTTARQNTGKISITFDDGYKSNFTAAKIMAPLKLTGTAYIIPDAINQKGHLSTAQLKEMKKMGWSLSSHLTTPVTQIDQLREVILKTKNIISKWGTPESAKHFALPLGKYNKKSLKILKSEFNSIRLAGGMAETLPVQDKMRLKTINVTSDMSPEEVLGWCTRAVENKEWAILMFHYIDRPEKGDLNYSSKKYEQLMKLLVPYAKNIQTVEQVLKQ